MLNDIYESSSKFLKAADLQGGKPVVEIETAEVKENTYEGQTKKQIVLTFAGKDKVLGLNFTNATRIAQLIGTEDFEQWPGWRIKLYVDQTKVEGRMVDCIRIFPDLPDQPRLQEAHTAAAAAPQRFSGAPVDDSDIPF